MWQTPKTDWEIKPYVDGRYQGDWFNVDDYNRIVGNLRYLHAAGQNVYDVIFDILGMSSAAVTEFPSASDINVLEDNLYSIIQNTYDPAYAGKTTWVGNGSTPTVDDLNRIEQACADLYAKYSEAPLLNFIPYGADALITTDGDTFMVRGIAGVDYADHGFVGLIASVFEDFGSIADAITDLEDWGTLA